MRSRLAAGVALATLALPAAASAHPGVYTVTQKVAGAGCTFPTTACLTERTQYAVANDGWALGFTEDNGLTTPGGGLINYKRMPSGWRAPMTAQDKLDYADAGTALQAHATCTLPALDDTAIKAWQGADPFFDYVPWQSRSAGLGDDPAKWLPVVKDKTGTDLTGMTDDQAKAACTNLAGSATAYHKADTPSNIADALLASVSGPLQSQVSQLQNQVGTLQAAKAASDAAAADAAAGKGRPLALTLSAKAFELPVAMVTGAPGTAVTVKLRLGSADARRLKVSRTAARKTKTLGAQGAELFTLTPSKNVAASRRSLRVAIEAAAGGKTRTSKGTLR
jgi:hypothetical protein